MALASRNARLGFSRGKNPRKRVLSSLFLLAVLAEDKQIGFMCRQTVPVEDEAKSRAKSDIRRFPFRLLVVREPRPTQATQPTIQCYVNKKKRKKSARERIVRASSLLLHIPEARA
jgi:hypothetical protein